MPIAVSQVTGVSDLRLEPLLFAGYERPGSEGGSFIRLITPQGAYMRLHPSPLPLAHASQSHPKLPAPSTLACSPSHPQKRTHDDGAVEAAAPPATKSQAAAQETLSTEVLPCTSTTAAAAVLSGPPDGFEVEFISSSSSAESSVLHSRTASPSPPPPAPHEVAAPGNGVLGQAPAGSTDMRVNEAVSLNEHVCDVSEKKSKDIFVASAFVHGTELAASAALLAEFDDALTTSALVLFKGRLPQSSPSQPPESGGETSPMWSEASNYHRAMLLGYDDAGFSYIEAHTFAQRTASPPGWRLCPLPLLVCAPESLAHVYEVVPLVGSSDAGDGVAEYSDVVARYPVLSRDAVSGYVEDNGGLGTGKGSCDGRTRAAPFSLPCASPTSSAYLTLPLRWSLPRCGHIPPLDLQHLFQVKPNRVYQLNQPQEEVVFVGVALGVPWVRSVTVAATAGPDVTSSEEVEHRGAPQHATASPASWPTVPPPAGYHWKDSPAWPVPLVGCHDARDIRVRCGLVDPAPAAAEGVSTNTVIDAEGSPKGPLQALSEAHRKTDHCDDQASLALTPPRSSPPLKQPAFSAPSYVRGDARVFVPGCFGVMLECDTKSALMEVEFGVVHGDRLVSRTGPALGTLTSLSRTSMLDRATSPPRPPGPFIVMGFQGRNVLVLLEEGGEKVAVKIHVTGGVAEVAELFCKVEGTPLPPPALPLEPLSGLAPPLEPAIVPGADLVLPSVTKEQDTREQLHMPSEAACPTRKESNSIITSSAPAAAQAPLVSGNTRGERREQMVIEEAGVATQVFDDDGNGLQSPTGAKSVTDLDEAPEDAAKILSATVIEDQQAALAETTFVYRAGRPSSRVSSTASTTYTDSHTSSPLVHQSQDVQSGMIGQTMRTPPDAFMTKAIAPNAHTQGGSEVDEVGTSLTTTPPLPEFVEDLTLLPAVKLATHDASPLGSVWGDGLAEATPSGTGVFQGEVLGAVAEAQSTDRLGGSPARLPTMEAAFANIPSHKHPLLQLPGENPETLEGCTEEHRPQMGSFSVNTFSSDHTPSVIPTPSPSTPHPSQGQKADTGPTTSLDPERDLGGNTSNAGRFPAAQESGPKPQPQGVGGAPVHNGDPVVMVCNAPSLFPSSQPQPNGHSASPTPHPGISATGETGPVTTMPRGPGARQPPESGKPFRESSSSSTAHAGLTFTPSNSPPPAVPSDCLAAYQVSTGQLMSDSALTPTTSALTTSVARTPFINFLKAYAIVVFGTRAAPCHDESTYLVNREPQHTNGCAIKTRKPSQATVQIADVLDFYREQPLSRITEAAAIQRRCRAAWRDAVFRNADPASLLVEGDIQVDKFLASASTTVFEELCVDELVSLLSIVISPVTET